MFKKKERERELFSKLENSPMVTLSVGNSLVNGVKNGVLLRVKVLSSAEVRPGEMTTGLLGVDNSDDGVIFRL